MYNLALFLFYLSASIYLFLLLCSFHLVFIRCKILLVAVTGPGKLAGRRLPMHRITRPTVQVLGHRKEATGDSPLFFNFTAIHKCWHLRSVCRRGVASTWERAERLMGD